MQNYQQLLDNFVQNNTKRETKNQKFVPLLLISVFAGGYTNACTHMTIT